MRHAGHWWCMLLVRLLKDIGCMICEKCTVVPVVPSLLFFFCRVCQLPINHLNLAAWQVCGVIWTCDSHLSGCIFHLFPPASRVWYLWYSAYVVFHWSGQLFQNPVGEVQKMAKEVGMEGRVRTVAFGVQDDRHLAEIAQTLNDCIESGHWLIMQNAHLPGGLWTGKLLHLLQVWRCLVLCVHVAQT